MPAAEANVRALVPLFNFPPARVSDAGIVAGVTLKAEEQGAVDGFLRSLRPCVPATEPTSVVRLSVLGLAGSTPFRRHGRVRDDSKELHRRVANARAASLYEALLDGQRRNAIEGLEIEPPRPYATPGDLEAVRENLRVSMGLLAGGADALERAAFVRLEQIGRCELLARQPGDLSVTPGQPRDAGRP